MSISKEVMEAIEKAAAENAANFGTAKDIFHSDYGWIMRNGELTEAGLKLVKENAANDEV